MSTNEENWLLQEKYHGLASADYLNDCQRLHSGEPLAYIIGHIPFLNCQIYLDSKPLIPRTETEYWTAAVIKKIESGRNRNLHILDLCAGSGCIGIAIAKAISEVKIDFVELDYAHLLTIKKNCLKNQIDLARVNISAGNLFFNLEEDQRYDHIVSNPPYIDPALDRTETSVKRYEPATALYGGKAGIKLIRDIILQAPNFLVASGRLWLEHEPEQTKVIHELAADRYSVLTHLDQYQQERFSELVLQ